MTILEALDSNYPFKRLSWSADLRFDDNSVFIPNKGLIPALYRNDLLASDWVVLICDSCMTTRSSLDDALFTWCSCDLGGVI